MRCIIALLLLFPANAWAATSNGAQFSGVATTTPPRLAQPTYICAVGDIQIGSNCDQWGDAGLTPDADGLACSEAMATDAKWVIEYMESTYPCDQIPWLGDLTDDAYPWEREILRDSVYEALSVSTQAKVRMVQGNHDASSTCGALDDYYNDAILQAATTGVVYRPTWWHERLPHATILGYSDNIIGQGATYTPTCFELATTWCYGDPAPGIGAGDPGDVCTSDSDCKSGLCGIWVDKYPAAMAAMLKNQNLALGNKDTAVVFYGHRPLCRGSTDTSCVNAPEFDGIRNIKECDTNPGTFCSRSGVNCPASAAFPAADSDCGTDAPGYDSRDQLHDVIQQIASYQTVVWFSGHVGGANPDTVPATVLGVEYLAVEIPGPYARGFTTGTQHAGVVRIDSTASPTVEVLEYFKAPNTAPVLITDPTAWSPSDGNDNLLLEGTDIDYGNLNYYWGAGSAARVCSGGTISITQNLAQGQDIQGVIDLNGCDSPGPYPASGSFTVCVTDGTPADADTPPTSGLSDCSDPFTIVVSP